MICSVVAVTHLASRSGKESQCPDRYEASDLINHQLPDTSYDGFQWFILHILSPPILYHIFSQIFNFLTFCFIFFQESFSWHGPTECLLNTIEACAIHVWPDVKEHFPFIYCVETFDYEHDYGQWGTCFEKLNLDPKPVTDCYASGLGDKLELQYAAETIALEPQHTYVPWLVVDGQPLYDDFTDFISYICKAYKGTTLPKACSESSLRMSTVEKANGNNPLILYATQKSRQHYQD